MKKGGTIASTPTEGFVKTRGADLFCRSIGEGQPVFVLHGGPEFDHTYLLPSMDALSAFCRLIYYDQRGRGRSEGEVDDVTVDSEILDLEDLRKHFQYERIALLGHSWGAILAMKYAVRFPQRVSHLILVNPASATYEDTVETRERRSASLKPFEEELVSIEETEGFVVGDPAMLRRFYQILFRPATKDPRHAAQLNFRLEHFTKEGVVRARAIEERLSAETLRNPAFDMTDELSRVRASTLVIHGADDFFPTTSSARIADSILGARLVTLKNCGHFTFLEAPEAYCEMIAGFILHPNG